MNGYVDDIQSATKANADFRRALYTGSNLLVLMTLQAVTTESPCDVLLIPQPSPEMRERA